MGVAVVCEDDRFVPAELVWDESYDAVPPPPDDESWQELSASWVLDEVLAGDPDARATSLLESIDPEQLPITDQPRYLRAWARIEAHAAARRLDAVRLLAEPAPNAHLPEPARRRVAELEVDCGAHEVAVALRIPLGTAHAHLRYARRLHSHLPATRALLTAGTISYSHAVRVIAAAEPVDDPDLAGEVERLGLRRAHKQTPGELAGAVARAVADLDPDAFRRRHQTAAATADVTLHPQPDGMAELTGYGDLIDLATTTKAADAYAGRRKADGDPRPLGVLRVEALRVFAETWLQQAKPTAHGRPVELHLAVTPETLTGLADTPAVLLGLGAPVPAHLTRRLLTEGAKLRRLLISPTTGHLLDYGTTTWTAPPDLAAYLRARHPVGAAPGATTPADRCDTEHAVPYPHGPTAPDNTTPQPRSWHNAKTHGGFTITIAPDGTTTWHTAKGQTADVEPFDYRLGP